MIEAYLKELLFEHDCVVIPDFGGFIAQPEGAEVHPITNKFYPPSKKIAFNEQLKMNDGLLVSTIAVRQGIDREKALKQIKAFVKEIQDALKARNKYIIKDIGKFFYNPENCLEFEPSAKINYLSDSFGLTDLFFKPIERNSTVMSNNSPRVVRPPMKKRTQKEVKLDENGNPVESKKTGLIVTLVLVPFLLLIGGAGFLIVNKDNQAYSSFNPFTSLNRNQVEKPAKTDSIITDTSAVANSEVQSPSDSDFGDNNDVVAQDNSVEEDAKTQEEHPIKKKRRDTPLVNDDASITNKQGRYFLIVGSFSNKENAYKLKEKLSADGIDATIIQPQSGTLYKVSAADFDSKQDAIKKQEELAGTYSSVWVMKY